MSRWIRAVPAGLVVAALCFFCGTGVLEAFQDDDSHAPSAVTVVYGDLESPGDDSGLTDQADPEDGETATDTHAVPSFATSRTDQPHSAERVRSLRPDRPPRLSHRG